MTGGERDRERFEDLPILRELRDRLELRFRDAEHNPARGMRRAGWPRGRSRLVVVLAVLLVAGGSAFAAVSLTGQRSAPLSGVVPPSPSGSPWQRSLAGSTYDIEIMPSLEAGRIGWCESLLYLRPGFGFGEGSCPTNTAAQGAPLFAESGTSGPGLWFVLAAPNVAAVRIAHGPTILTRADPRLPFGFRAAVTDLKTALPQEIPQLTALDAAGRPIPGGADTYPAKSPTRRWRSSQRVKGSCSIGTRPGSPVRALGGTVVTAIVPDPGIIGHAFLPCVNARLAPHGARDFALLAALLLDAKHPGATLAALPGMQPVPGQPGILDRPTPSTATHNRPNRRGRVHRRGGPPGSRWGGLTARRVGNAWLVVEGATLPQRIRALHELTVGPIDLHRPHGPASAPAGAVCSIGLHPLAGLQEVSQIAYPGARHRPRNGPANLTNCSGADFYLHGRPLTATALLPVGRPGVPPALKTARPVRGHPDMFTIDERPDLITTWRRIGTAWLTITGGTSPHQQQTVLSHLTLSHPR